MTVDQMQLIADFIMKEEGREPVQVVRNGRNVNSVANNKWSRRQQRWIRKISIIEKAFTEYSDIVALAEIVHECCHYLYKEGLGLYILDHNNRFKEFERKWLGQFGLTPIGYKKAYYTHLMGIDKLAVPTRPWFENSRSQRKSPNRYEDKVAGWEKEFLNDYFRFGFRREDLGRKFIYNQRTYRIVGLHTRSYKYPVLVKSMRYGKYYRMSCWAVQQALEVTGGCLI